MVNIGFTKFDQLYEFEQKWLEERRKKITASSVGSIVKHKQTTKISSGVKQLLNSKDFMETELWIGTYCMCHKKVYIS